MTSTTTALALPASNSERYYREIAASLDEILAARPTGLAELHELEGLLSAATNALEYADYDRPEESPTLLLADFEVGLRLQDVWKHLDELWASAPIRRDVLVQLSGLHHEILGPPGSAHEVLFELPQYWHHDLLNDAVRSLALPEATKLAHSYDQFLRRCFVIRAPHWVWAMFRALVLDPALYEKVWDETVSGIWPDLEKRGELCPVGDPVPAGPVDPVAFVLWEPGTTSFAAATRAAAKL